MRGFFCRLLRRLGFGPDPWHEYARIDGEMDRMIDDIQYAISREDKDAEARARARYRELGAQKAALSEEY